MLPSLDHNSLLYAFLSCTHRLLHQRLTHALARTLRRTHADRQPHAGVQPDPLPFTVAHWDRERRRLPVMTSADGAHHTLLVSRAAFVLGRQVLVCDEATSNLDSVTDELIHDILLNLSACPASSHSRPFAGLPLRARASVCI